MDCIKPPPLHSRRLQDVVHADNVSEHFRMFVACSSVMAWHLCPADPHAVLEVRGAMRRCASANGPDGGRISPIPCDCARIPGGRFSPMDDSSARVLLPFQKQDSSSVSPQRFVQ